MRRVVLRCFRCEQRYEREMDEDAIAALTCVDHACPDCLTAGRREFVCPIWGLKSDRCC